MGTDYSVHRVLPATVEIKTCSIKGTRTDTMIHTLTVEVRDDKGCGHRVVLFSDTPFSSGIKVEKEE